MSGHDDLPFKISMLGPTRVGKTSVIATMLHESQQLLTGTPVTMRATDDATASRISRTRKALRGALLAREFRPGSLQNNTEHHWYNLTLDPGVPGAGVRFRLLDFPGELMDPERRSNSLRSEAWSECESFIEQSSILIIPVDATVLMEASRKEYRRAWPTILALDEVADTAGRWASTRRLNLDEPALLLFCPVKCESYFADNGGRRDASAELFSRFIDAYQGTVDRVRGEHPGSIQLYCPVDTIGCVELQYAEWVEDAQDTSGWKLDTTFALRPDVLGRGSDLQPFGIDDILRLLCGQLLEARRSSGASEADLAAGQYRVAQEFAERREGLFKDIWLWASRERARRQKLATATGQEAAEIRHRLLALDKIVRDIAGRERGPRVRDL